MPGTVLAGWAPDRGDGRGRIRLLWALLGIHALIGGALLMVVGTQVLALGLCAHAYGTYYMGERDPWFDRMRARFRLEHGLMLGGLFVLIGLVLGGVIVGTWISHGFGSLADEHLAVVAATGDHRGHPDLLLLLPVEDSRSAPRP